jgi:Fur family zinc uptake transcriptional regulator
MSPHDHHAPNHGHPSGVQDLAFAPHDHATCTTDALAEAEAMARARGLRLTPVRRRVLEILLESHRAMGAYDVLARLGEEGYGNQPPVAYRALEFLEENGLAHRIRRLNAFAACMHPGRAHSPVFLICTTCEKLSEAPEGAVRDALSLAAQEVGFAIETSVIEAVGLCHSCHAAAQP